MQNTYFRIVSASKKIDALGIKSRIRCGRKLYANINGNSITPALLAHALLKRLSGGIILKVAI
jgi:hypothetical protein